MISAVHADSPLLRESLNIPIIQLARVSQYHEDVSRDLTEKLQKAHQIQNYPGFPAVSGADLAAAFQKHLGYRAY